MLVASEVFMARARIPVGSIALAAAALLAVAADARRADAGCATAVDARALQRTVRYAARCNDKVFRLGPGTTCQQSAPPACAGTLATDAVALAYGANNPAASAVNRTMLRSVLNCQRSVGRAVTNYVGRKLRYLVNGLSSAEADARAGKLFDRLPDHCFVTVALDQSGVVLPAAGPQCGAAVPGPGGSVDATALRDCIRTLLSVWVDRWGPNPQPLRPNILFILSDDQRWDTTDATHGLNGTEVMPRTRAELADSGIEFPEAFMTTPLCCPSRSSILTGEVSHRTGV